MDSQNWYEEIARAEQANESVMALLKQLKQEMAGLVEQNVSLRLENTYLREKLDALNAQQSDLDGVHVQTVGLSNLEKLYQSGTHICHTFYGAKREGLCLLCETLLSQHEE